MEIKTKTPLDTTSNRPLLRLSSEAITSFQSIYFKEFGLHINEQEADRIGLGLLRLIKSIYKPIKSSTGAI